MVFIIFLSSILFGEDKWECYCLPLFCHWWWVLKLGHMQKFLAVSWATKCIFSNLLFESQWALRRWGRRVSGLGRAKELQFSSIILLKVKVASPLACEWVPVIVFARCPSHTKCSVNVSWESEFCPPVVNTHCVLSSRTPMAKPKSGVAPLSILESKRLNMPLSQWSIS